MIPWKQQIDELERLALDLKLKRDFAGMLPIRQEIARLLEANGADAKQVACSLNYLGALNLQLKRYSIAEAHARRSVSYYEENGAKDREVLATFINLLAWILAFQGRIDEAIPYAERAIVEYSVFHSPEDDFLRQRKADLRNLRNGILNLNFDF